MQHIHDLIARGALFVINHSGGKDSQAMTLLVRRLMPRDQIVVIHASLGKVEWPGTIEHIRATTGGLPLIVTEAVDRHGRTKRLLDMAEARGMWPSPQQRQCTSDLKRGPIEKAIRHHLKRNPRFNGLVVNCMGLRAQESAGREKKPAFAFNPRNSKAGREWYDWLPIHDMTVERVFRSIRDAGQRPHWAYAAGMSRLSCCFCIFATEADLKTAAGLMPDLHAEYVGVERRTGHTLIMPRKGEAPRTLDQITGVPVPEPADTSTNARAAA